MIGPLQTAGSPRILVVDDEPDLRAMVAEYLGRYGFRVRQAGCGAELDLRLAEEPADLILLDVAMPGEDGLSILRRLQGPTAPPVIMVTSAGETIDRVVGIEVGADDYVSKPFDLRELRARIGAVLRRVGAPGPATPDRESSDRAANAAELVSLGCCQLDLAGCCLIDQGGARHPLTSMEFDLLQTFARHPNRVLSRDRLLELAHNRDWEPFDRSIDIRIARIRRKVELDPAKPQIIKTVRGAGYIFIPPKPGR